MGTLLLIGEIEALLIRLQLARTDNDLLAPEMYDQIFSIYARVLSM